MAGGTWKKVMQVRGNERAGYPLAAMVIGRDRPLAWILERIVDYLICLYLWAGLCQYAQVPPPAAAAHAFAAAVPAVSNTFEQAWKKAVQVQVWLFQSQVWEIALGRSPWNGYQSTRYNYLTCFCGSCPVQTQPAAAINAFTANTPAVSNKLEQGVVGNDAAVGSGLMVTATTEAWGLVGPQAPAASARPHSPFMRQQVLQDASWSCDSYGSIIQNAMHSGYTPENDDANGMLSQDSLGSSDLVDAGECESWALPCVIVAKCFTAKQELKSY